MAKMCCAFCNSGKSSNSWDKSAKKLANFVFFREKAIFFQKKRKIKKNIINFAPVFHKVDCDTVKE